MKRNTLWLVAVAMLVGNVALTVTTTHDAKAREAAPMSGVTGATLTNNVESANQSSGCNARSSPRGFTCVGRIKVHGQSAGWALVF